MRFNVSVIVEQNGRREQGYAGAGGRYSLAELVANDRPLALGREAVRQALVNLEAIPAPAGTMTVVLGPGWPGVLLHEAIGHGLEGDFNRKGTSAFANRIGERVATRVAPIVDDGTLSRRRGSLNIDDEGTPTQCTTLIENGVLKGYLQDKWSPSSTSAPRSSSTCPATEWEPDRLPTDAELLGFAASSLARQPLRVAKALARTASVALDVRRRGQERNAPVLPPAPFTAPRTSFNTALTPRRSYSFTSLDLRTVKAVKAAAGCTVNDVVMALCSGALRIYLDKRGEVLDSSLVAMVPVSVRTEDERDALGNKVS